MRGEFLGVWGATWREIWMPVQEAGEELNPELRALLIDHDLPEEFEPYPDLIAALYLEAFYAFRKDLKEDKFGDEPDEVRQRSIDVAQITNEPERAYSQFEAIESHHFSSEASLVIFFEKVHGVFEEFDELLAKRYGILLNAFIEKYSLRYDFEPPCQIYPTLPGIFASLFGEITALSAQNNHLDVLMQEFRSAFRDFRTDWTENRIKTCIHKLINLIEAISLHHPNVTKSKTLGAACRELRTWPHTAVQEFLSNLYGFSSDYPGLRHAGNPDARIRQLDARDLIALCVTLAGYIPYLTDEIDCQSIYMPHEHVD